MGRGGTGRGGQEWGIGDGHVNRNRQWHTAR